jgi:hypothetical protein
MPVHRATDFLFRGMPRLAPGLAVSDAPPSGSLFARLSRMLDAASAIAHDTPAAAPDSPTLEPSPEVSKELRAAEATLTGVAQMVEASRDRMWVLLGAAQRAGIVPVGPTVIPAYLQAYIPPYASYLARDPAAAKLVASVVLRFEEVTVDLERARVAVARGDLAGAHLEAIRGKYLFLCKIKIYFKDHPMLQKFFSNEPDSISERATSSEDRRIAGRYAGYTAPLGEHKASSGTDKLQLGALKRVGSGLISESQQLIDQAGKLLRGLEIKMLILRAAVDETRGGARTTGGLLPAPALKTAMNVAAVIQGDEALAQRTRDFLDQYSLARRLLLKRPPDLPALRAALGKVSSYPARFREVPVMGALLGA